MIDGILNTPGVTLVELKGSTYSLEACQAIAAAIAQRPSIHTGVHGNSLQLASHCGAALLDDMYTRRKPEAIHPSLAAFANALLKMDNLTHVDFRCSAACY